MAGAAAKEVKSHCVWESRTGIGRRVGKALLFYKTLYTYYFDRNKNQI